MVEFQMILRRRYVAPLILLSAAVGCSGEGDSPIGSSGGSTAMTSSGGTGDFASGGSAATGGSGSSVTTGGTASGGGTGGGGAADTGGASTGGGSADTGGSESTGGSDPGPTCDPSGDNKTVLNNEDHTVYQATGFENGTVDPFVICTTRSPSYGRGTEFMGRNVLEFQWTETGSTARVDKGAEACGGPRFHKEGWYGFQFYLPDPGFPKDKFQGIAQIFGLGGCSSWVSKLDVKDNSLLFSRRGHCGTAVDTVIAEDIERNKWHSVIIHFIASHAEQGLTEVWFDEDVCNQAEPTYRATDINYGFGDADPDGWDTATDSLKRQAIDPNSQGGFREFGTNEIEFKIGMYNFDNTNYTPGESRTLYYDNVSMLADEGESGFIKVNPAF